MSKSLGLINAVLTTTVIGAIAYYGIQAKKADDNLINTVNQIEEKVFLNLKQDFRTMKPESYKELMIKSDRIFSHVTFLAETKYKGDIMHPDLVDYADRAYDSVMENMYENAFYERLYTAGVKVNTAVPFEVDEDGDYLYGDDVLVEHGVLLRGKYHLEMQGEGIYARLKNIPAGIMLMNNDLLKYPKCEVGMRPFVIFGEMYPEGGQAYGVNLMTENHGWRVSFKDVDIMSDEALRNRLIFQTACQHKPQETKNRDVESRSVPVDTEATGD